MTTVTVNTPALAKAPRGSVWLATAFAAFLNWAERVGTARAERYIAATRITEATDLRNYARSVNQQDHRFAADLFAAADRHERGV